MKKKNQEHSSYSTVVHVFFSYSLALSNRAYVQNVCVWVFFHSFHTLLVWFVYSIILVVKLLFFALFRSIARSLFNFNWFDRRARSLIRVLVISIVVGASFFHSAVIRSYCQDEVTSYKCSVDLNFKLNILASL